MREEPVIYINGKPYVVREAGQPFANLEYTGIDRSRVEDMEVGGCPAWLWVSGGTWLWVQGGVGPKKQCVANT